MKERVTKEIAQMLKDAGYKLETTVFKTLMGDLTHTKEDISVSEAIEWLDSKGVYVVPFLIYVGLRPNGWGCRITFKNEQYWDYECVREIKDTRLAAYTAGLPIAIDYIKNKKG
jgi:hypothetical protein